MGTISEIYHVSCEWVKNREAEVHMHAIIEGHADQNQRNYKVKLKDRGQPQLPYSQLYQYIKISTIISLYQH